MLYNVYIYFAYTGWSRKS